MGPTKEQIEETLAHYDDRDAWPPFAVDWTSDQADAFAKATLQMAIEALDLRTRLAAVEAEREVDASLIRELQHHALPSNCTHCDGNGAEPPFGPESGPCEHCGGWTSHKRLVAGECTSLRANIERLTRERDDAYARGASGEARAVSAMMTDAIAPASELGVTWTGQWLDATRKIVAALVERTKERDALKREIVSNKGCIARDLGVSETDFEAWWIGNDYGENYPRVDRVAQAFQRARTTLRAHAAGDVACAIDATGHAPKCSHCDRPATCFGAYEDERNIGYGCDECCGHGCEDGWCRQLSDDPNAPMKMLAKYATESADREDEGAKAAEQDATIVRIVRENLTADALLADERIPLDVKCAIAAALGGTHG